MWPHSLFNRTNPTAPPATTGRRRRRVTRKPPVEVLEDRTLLNFSPAVNFPVAANPLDMVVGDFNGDGKADLVTINDAELSVLVGDGDGTFGAAQTITAGPGLRSVAAGHFNGDGRLDLAITSSATTGAVLVLLNNTAALGGPATFQAARSFSTGTNLTPGAVAVGDLNGDGKLDVAAAQAGGSNVTVLRGDGAGNLGPARHVAVAANPVSVAVGDLDGDGRLDLVTANQGSNTVSTLRNGGNDAAGDVQFQPATSADVLGSPASVAVGDFNDDGLMDLAATSQYSSYSPASWWYDPNSGQWWGGGGYWIINGYVNVLLGHGDGAFDPARSTWLNGTWGAPSSGSGAGELAVDDFNGDGKLDVATAEGVTPVSVDPTVLLGAGDGNFSAIYFYNGGTGPNATVTGDFNGDTFPDVAVANYYSWDVTVLRNDTDWRTLVVGRLPASPTAGQTQTFTVTVRDNAGNVQTGYTGTMHFTSSDPRAELLADYQFTAADVGVHTFTVTFKTAGSQWVSAADPAAPRLSGSISTSVAPAAVSTLLIGGGGNRVTSGSPASVTVSAFDAYGNAATNYTGTVRFTSSDGQAILPADYTFSERDSGSARFAIPLQTVGIHSITVTDRANPGVTATLSGIRVVPRVTLSGMEGGFLNQAMAFTLGADSGLPTGTVFTYTIDWDGNGVVDQTVTGPSGTTVQHSYANTGGYGIRVTATVTVDGQAYTSDTVNHWVDIYAVTVTVQADPGDATRSALVVQGTADYDNLVLRRGSGSAIDLLIHGRWVGSYSAPGGTALAHLLVYGNGGDDVIQVTGGVTVPALLFGGDGTDSLYADGSSANNVLVGGASDDWLYGGSGRDLLIGGLGVDRIQAAHGGSILIGGYTDHDTNVAALLAIMKEWGRTDADYNTRVKHLSGSLSGGLNGSYRLTANTVHNDNAIDRLYGWDGMDWFVISGSGKKKDTINNASGEVVSTF